MIRLQRWFLGMAILALIGPGAYGSTPATPSHIQIEQRIQQIRTAWDAPEIGSQPNAADWTAFFDALQAELRNHSAAIDNSARLRSLDRLYRFWLALRDVPWGPAAEVRTALEEWLRPRIALSWAELQLGQAVSAMPTTENQAAQENRDRWIQFRDDLRAAFREYEAAPTVLNRRAALRKIQAGLDSLREGTTQRPWGPALSMQSALDQLFDRPNLSATASVETLAPFLNQNVVNPEVIFFKGQTSYVTPGVKTGFGLLPSNEGIAFYNSQYSHSVTPIQGFQQQVAQDPQGQRAANLYHFSATGYNTAHVNAVSVLTPNGLFLYPNTDSNISAGIGSAKIPGFGRHVTRSVASLIGLNQQNITNQVRQQAVPQIQREAEQGTQELAQIKSAQQQAEINAQLRQFLPGNQSLVYQQIAVTELSLASQPQYALIGGLIRWMGAPNQGGADFPKPPAFQTWQPGVTADIHLPSVLTNLAAGFLQSPMAQEVENFMIEIRPSGEANGEPEVEIQQNVDYATFVQAVRASRETGNPQALAVRITKPSDPPEFSADINGNLVAILNNLILEVPAPPGGVMGTPAEVIRVNLPTAAVALSFQVTTNEYGSLEASGVITNFQPGPGTQVFTLGETDDDPRAVNILARAGVIGILTSQLRGQAFEQEIPAEDIPGVIVREVSELDPTGWLRVVVQPTGGGLNLGSGAFATTAPAPAIPSPTTLAVPTVFGN